MSTKFLSMDYPCAVYDANAEYSSACDLYEALVKRTGDKKLSMYQANMLKFQQNTDLAMMLIGLGADEIYTGDPDIDGTLLMCRDFILSQFGESSDKTLTAKVHVENDIIIMETKNGNASYNIVDKRVACAYMRMSESDFFYTPGEETTITYKECLLDEFTFIDILSDIQSYHEDDQEMIDYLSKAMVRYFLQDNGCSASAEALLYCGF